MTKYRRIFKFSVEPYYCNKYIKEGERKLKKKYSVHVEFPNGNVLDFETDSDIKTAKRKWINGGYFIITKEAVINELHVKEMNITRQR